jgi:hypothetical protein
MYEGQYPEHATTMTDPFQMPSNVARKAVSGG